MRDCTDCKWATWKRTANGRLHPSGNGRCVYPYSLRPLPASFHWIGGEPVPSGGYIKRTEYLSDHCAYYTRATE